MLPNQLTAMENNTGILTAQITTRHGLYRVDWDASELIAAGGGMGGGMNVLPPEQIEITYPNYQSTRNAANIYKVHAVAHDTKGNRSERAVTSTVTARIPSNNHSKTIEFEFSQLGEFSNVFVNGALFSVNAGFPKTGFINAKFQMYIDGDNSTNDQYDWQSSHPNLATVNNVGEVTLVADFTQRTPITITAIPRDAPRRALAKEYTFDIDKWAISPGNGHLVGNYGQAAEFCGRPVNSGFSIPKTQLLTSGTARTPNGLLYNEWGDISSYSWNGNHYWTSDLSLLQERGIVNLRNGTNRYLGTANTTTSVICLKTL